MREGAGASSYCVAEQGFKQGIWPHRQYFFQNTTPTYFACSFSKLPIQPPLWISLDVLWGKYFEKFKRKSWIHRETQVRQPRIFSNESHVASGFTSEDGATVAENLFYKPLKHTLEMESQHLKCYRTAKESVFPTLSPKQQHSCDEWWGRLSSGLSLAFKCVNYLTET